MSYLNTAYYSKQNFLLLQKASKHKLLTELNSNKNSNKKSLWLRKWAYQNFWDGIGLKSDKDQSPRGKYFKYFCLKSQDVSLNCEEDSALTRNAHTTVICWCIKKTSETLLNRQERKQEIQREVMLTAVNKKEINNIVLFNLWCFHRGITWLGHKLASSRAFTSSPGQPGSCQNLLQVCGCKGIQEIIQMVHLKSSY